MDEVYLEATLGQDTTPAAGRSDAFVTVNSLTKSFGLAGLRVGWVIADPETIQRIRRVRDIVDGSGAVPSERLAVIAFEHIDRLLARARSILEPHWVMVKRFVESRRGAGLGRAGGGELRGVPQTGGRRRRRTFVEMARTEFGVGLVPGRFFGAPAHFRIAMSGGGACWRTDSRRWAKRSRTGAPSGPLRPGLPPPLPLQRRHPVGAGIRHVLALHRSATGSG